MSASMTPEEFFACQELQTDRYELVDGRPCKLTRASNLHDDIVVNLVSALRQKLRGSGCRPFWRRQRRNPPRSDSAPRCRSRLWIAHTGRHDGRAPETDHRGSVAELP